jgi:uncharacterized protein with HEPN domain
MENRVNTFLRHILQSIELLEDYCKDANEEKFANSTPLQDMVFRRLEIIGEAVKNLPDEFKNKHKNAERKKIAGLRDVLIHNYFGIDYELAWKVVEKDIPVLKRNILEIKSSL